jgi:hypothetical protein
MLLGFILPVVCPFVQDIFGGNGKMEIKWRMGVGWLLEKRDIYRRSAILLRL